MDERDPMELALSNDLVMDIVLSHLKVIDLLSCRLASKFWNKAASSVLRKRRTMIKNISDKKCLMELEECMKKSSDFPFAGLKFDKPWTLNSGFTTKFFKNYGARFTRLCLDTHCTIWLDLMVPFIHHLPCLSVLEMALSDSRPPHPRLKLWHSDAEVDDGEFLNLSSLRTLRIFCPSVAQDVLGEVLLAASSSTLQIECLQATPQVFVALKEAGKLQAVSFIRFDKDSENWTYKSKMDKLLSTESPSLSKLSVNARGCLSLDGLEKILLASQGTLKEFHLDAKYMKQEELKDLRNKFPVLPKLAGLSLRVTIDSCLQYLFQGRHGPKFPALKIFKLVDDPSYKDPVTRFSNCLFIVPSVTRIDLKGYASEHAMKYLAQVFPNVNDIRLECKDYYSSYRSSERGQSQIWSVRAFKCLERLRIWNYKVEKYRKRLVMDSFLTGIPAGICDNLRRHKKLNLIHSRWNELSRAKPSILQLEHLKELIVCLKLADGLKELPEDPQFMSMVSVWYGLEMMPNLRATFTYEVSLPRSPDEERYKAVLEAALKDVRPYVTLEPFFY